MAALRAGREQVAPGLTRWACGWRWQIVTGGQRTPPASAQFILMHLSKGPQRGHSSKPYYRQV